VAGVGLSRVEHGKDVRMLKLGGDVDLVQEPLGPERTHQLGTQDLERHVAVVLSVVCQIHRGHPAVPELALDHVPFADGRHQRGR
jgi:hypothetical protein